MGVEVLDATLDVNDLSGDDVFDEESPKSKNLNVDARRRLENKLEEMRLQRELRNYDFDF